MPNSFANPISCLILAALIPGWAPWADAQSEDLYAKARQQLVKQHIESAGVTNTRVLQAMRETPRHEFIPRGLRDRAYFDMALPIGDAQTISSPFIVAWMTEAIDPQPTDKVLEIGTGSGYQAAVLSSLVAEVYSIEIVKPLGEKAAEVLEDLEYKNVHVRVGDGFLGWPEQAPFDKIIVTCSPESVPQPLIDQLREGGQMIIPVGQRYQQTLYLMTKQDGKLIEKALQPTLFVPMTGTAEASRKQLPDPTRPEIVNGNFETVVTAQATVEPAAANQATVGDDAEVTSGTSSGTPAAPSSSAVPGWYYGKGVSVQTGKAFEGSQFVRFENQVPDLSAHLLQGFPLDGRHVSAIRVSGALRLNSVKAGQGPESSPAIAVSLYDEQRREVGLLLIGPYVGTRAWKSHSRVLAVPPQAREAIVRIGLFGATGSADFDAVKIEPVR